MQEKIVFYSKMTCFNNNEMHIFILVEVQPLFTLAFILVLITHFPSIGNHMITIF